MPADHSPDPARHRQRCRRAKQNKLPDGLPLLIGTAAAVFVALVLVAVVIVGGCSVIRERRPAEAAAAVASPPDAPARAEATATPPAAARDFAAAYEGMRAAYRDNKLNAESAYVGTRWRFTAQFVDFGFRWEDGIQVNIYFGHDTTVFKLPYAAARSLHAGKRYIFEGDLRHASLYSWEVLDCDFENVALIGPAPAIPPPPPPRRPSPEESKRPVMQIGGPGDLSHLRKK